MSMSHELVIIMGCWDVQQRTNQHSTHKQTHTCAAATGLAGGRASASALLLHSRVPAAAATAAAAAALVLLGPVVALGCAQGIHVCAGVHARLCMHACVRECMHACVRAHARACARSPLCVLRTVGLLHEQVACRDPMRHPPALLPAAAAAVGPARVGGLTPVHAGAAAPSWCCCPCPTSCDPTAKKAQLNRIELGMIHV